MYTTLLQSAGNVPDFDPGPLYEIIYPVHSIMRYVILILIIWAIAVAAKGRKNDAPWATKLKKPAFYTMLAIDIQFLLGIYLWVVRLLNDTQNLSKLKIVVKAPVERAILMEHSLIMLIAIVLVHIGYAKAKKAATDQLKAKRIFNFYLIAVILIVIGVVYIMQAAQRGLLPAM